MPEKCTPVKHPTAEHCTYGMSDFAQQPKMLLCWESVESSMQLELGTQAK